MVPHTTNTSDPAGPDSAGIGLGVHARALPRTGRGDDAEGDSATVLLPIDVLRPADSPRRDGVDEAHIRVLAESEEPLPPILVHRRSGRVIDGMHRLEVARLRGRSHVPVQFFDGDDDAAFVHAVVANVAHGLPLSLADREAAACRIIRSYPHWSNGAVAKASGISAKTVGTLRSRSTRDVPELDKRLGQDGRLRPINGAVGRQLATDLLAQHPEASLRAIARAAGISPETVRDVRERLRRGEDPVPPAQRRDPRSTSDSVVGNRPRPARRADPDEGEPLDPRILHNLRRDPSLRYTESGRNLLRWLDRYVVRAADGSGLFPSVPPHCLPILAQLARQCAREWREASEQLEQQLRETA